MKFIKILLVSFLFSAISAPCYAPAEEAPTQAEAIPPAPAQDLSLTGYHSVGPPNSAAKARFDRALERYGAGYYEASLSTSLAMAKDFHGTIWAGRALFLAARASVAAKELEHASGLFDEAALKYPVLADYSVFLPASAYMDAHEYKGAAVLYARLVRVYPESPLVPSSLIMLGEAYVELGSWRDAVKTLDSLIGRKPNPTQAAKARYLLVKAYEGLKDPASAVHQYRTLWLDYPESPLVYKAEAIASRLSKPGTKAIEPTFRDRMARGERLYNLGIYRQASEELGRALKLAAGDRQKGRALLRLGMSSYRLRADDEAKEYLEQAVKTATDGDDLSEALYWLCRTCLRTGESVRFEEAAYECASLFPESTKAVDSLYLLGTEYRYNRDFDDATAIFEYALDTYPRSERADELLWQLGWSHYGKGDYKAAGATFGRLAHGHPGSSLVPQALYWQAKALSAQGIEAEASACRKKLSDEHGLSYYGFMAGIGEGTVSIDPGTTPILARDVPEPGPYRDAALERAYELGLQGMKSEGAREARRAEKDYSGSIAGIKVLSGLYAYLGDYNRPLMLASGIYEQRLNSGRSNIPADALTIIYPLGYWETIKTQSESFGLDPLLVAALIRQESRFNPGSVSRAGAGGLMQIMPETAGALCRRLGIEHKESEGLSDSAFNVLLGTCYLKSLLDKHDGRLVYALAEYNAGPRALSKWTERMAGAPDDEFVDGISYAETRNYVKHVVRDYHVYRMLYSTLGTSK